MNSQLSQFEEINIPPVLLAEMYSQTLVVIDSIKKNTANKPSAAVPNNAPLPPTTDLEPPPNIKKLEESAAPAIKTPVNRLGGFGKSVLVILNDAEAVHVSDAELDLLVKMLAAVDLSLADIALVNMATQPISLPELQEELPASATILFGVEPSSVGLPMRFPYFQVQKWNNAVFLYSPSLRQMNTVSAGQNEQKRNLWNALKQIFKS